MKRAIIYLFIHNSCYFSSQVTVKVCHLQRSQFQTSTFLYTQFRLLNVGELWLAQSEVTWRSDASRCSGQRVQVCDNSSSGSVWISHCTLQKPLLWKTVFLPLWATRKAHPGIETSHSLCLFIKHLARLCTLANSRVMRLQSTYSPGRI